MTLDLFGEVKLTLMHFYVHYVLIILDYITLVIYTWIPYVAYAYVNSIVIGIGPKRYYRIYRLSAPKSHSVMVYKVLHDHRL